MENKNTDINTDISFSNYNVYINDLQKKKLKEKTNTIDSGNIIEDLTEEEQKIKDLKYELDELKRNYALERVFENNDDIELNLELNGFGLIVIKEHDHYKILYDKNKYNLQNESYYNSINNNDDDENNTKIEKNNSTKNIFNIYNKNNDEGNINETNEIDNSNNIINNINNDNINNDNINNNKISKKKSINASIIVPNLDTDDNNIKKEILYNSEFSLENKIFYTYQIDVTKSLLIIKSQNLQDDILNKEIDHELMIYENIQIDYNKNLVIDFNKELYSNKAFTMNAKKREIIKVLNELYSLSEMKMETHNESSKKYNCYNLWLVFPSIFISAASGILSFISSSEVVDSNSKVYFTITVGVLASITTFIQSISNTLNYNGKMEAHNMAMDEYDNIRTRVKFELNNPSESLNDPASFYDKIKTSILDIKKKCNYPIPNEIQDKYEKTKLNNYFKQLKYNILDEAFKKKAQKLKKKIYKDSKRLTMNNINTKMTYSIPINS